MLKVRSDLHVHTTLSGCCSDPSQTLEELIPYLAREKHLHTVAFTDHLWANPAQRPSSWYVPQNGEGQLKLLERVRAERAGLPLRVLVGGEVEMIAPGKFCVTPEFARKLDIVLLASDHFHMRGLVAQPDEPTPAKIARHMMDFFRSAACCDLVDILVHPLMPMSYETQYDAVMKCVSEPELDEAMRMAAEHGIAIEINANLLWKNANAHFYDPDTYLRVLAAAKHAHCRFSFGSDSHRRGAFDLYNLIEDAANAVSLTEDDLHPLARA